MSWKGVSGDAISIRIAILDVGILGRRVLALAYPQIGRNASVDGFVILNDKSIRHFLFGQFFQKRRIYDKLQNVFVRFARRSMKEILPVLFPIPSFPNSNFFLKPLIRQRENRNGRSRHKP
jgi:hypothetical protein